MITVVAGQSQRTIIGDDFPEPVMLRVTRGGVPVTGAALEVTGDGIDGQISLMTDADGRAEFRWQAIEDYTQRAQAALTGTDASSSGGTTIFGRAVYRRLCSGVEETGRRRGTAP